MLTDICFSAYSVEIIDESSYFCNCKGAYTSGGICSHSAAAKHLDKLFNIESKLKSISRAKKCGRPLGYQPVGYSARLPNEILSENQASAYIGTPIARRFEDSPDKIFTGEVDGVRLLATSVTSADAHIVFNVTYPVQYKDDIEYTEELTLTQVRSGNRFYTDYRKKINSH